jgi:hypothetical protein
MTSKLDGIKITQTFKKIQLKIRVVQFLSILFKNFIKYFNGITETFNSKQNDTALGFIKMVLTKNNKKQQ